MQIWSSEIKELEKLYDSIKGQFPGLDKELEQLIRSEDANVVMLYSRRCLEVVVSDLCECELKRPRKTEPLQGIIDKLNKEGKVPSNIVISMQFLNSLSNFGTHPKDFDPEQVKPVLNNLATIIKWYQKYKDTLTIDKTTSVREKKLPLEPLKNVKQESPEGSINNLTYGLRSKRRLLRLISVFLFVIGILAIYLITNYSKQKQYLLNLEKSIAVLPFVNDSPVDSNKYFINGIMEEVLNNLQKIKDFRVLSRTSTDQYKGSDKPTLPEIAEKLDVNYIVEGSGQKYGNKFVLRIQLIRATGKESHLWGKSYEQEIRETSDIINIQSQIAKAIAAELKITITPEEKQIIEKTPTEILLAYDLYQKGKEELSKHISSGTNKVNRQIQINNMQALVSAGKMFNDALKCDSTFALAYAGLARVYFIRDIMPDSVLILASKALSHDKQLSEAYILRGIYYWNRGNNSKANYEYNKALTVNPNSWEAYYYKGMLNESEDLKLAIDYLQKAASLNRGSELADIKYEISRLYRFAGFYEKSEDIALEVLELDGDSVRYYSSVSTAEVYLGNNEKSLELRERAYAIDSTNLTILYQFGESYRRSGNWEETLRYLKKYFANGGSSPINLLTIGYAYLKNGYKKEAKDYFDRLMIFCENDIKTNPQDLSSYYYFASVYAIRGDTKKAYENLKRYSQMKIVLNKDISMMTFPWFDSLKNEQEFKKIVSEMNTKFQVQHEKVRKWLEGQK